jgi:NADH:ubiquinone oxidoreductase subunit 2 (subunit N)
LGKLLIFQGALQADLLPLAIVLGVNSAISVAYYLFMAKAVFVDDEELTGARVGQTSGGLKLTCVVCAAAVFGSWFFGSTLQSLLGAPNEAAVKVERPVVAQTQR